MAPLFIQRSRQRAAEAQEWPAEEPATSLPPRSRNPFADAARDLAADWDAMVVERDSARDEAERHKGENIYLSGKVDELTRELASRIEWFEVESAAMRNRADRAVDDATAIRAKLTVIAQAIRMVLDEEQAVAKREPRQESARESSIAAPPSRNLSTVRVSGVKPSARNGDYVMQDFAQTPPEGHDISENDAEDARDLINRLAPVALKR